MKNHSDNESQPPIVAEEPNNQYNAVTQIELTDTKAHYIGANEEESE